LIVLALPELWVVPLESALLSDSAAGLPSGHFHWTQRFLFGNDSGNKVIGECLKTLGVTPCNKAPIPLHIRFAEKVDHVLLPLFPIFGVQQLEPGMVLVDFFEECEPQIAQMMQLGPIIE
jgi:hypothetical protein